MVSLSQVRRSVSHHLTDPAVRLLVRTSITPNALTWFGFVIAIGAALLVATENLLAAGFVVLVGGFFDMLDGALARRTNRVTRFGAVLDSTLDRLSEGVLLLGIIALFAKQQSITGVLLVGAALITSLLVSYIRARAEAQGLKCTVGLFTRPERVIVLALGLLLNQVEIALAIIVVFSLFTVGQRLVYVWQQTKNK